VSAQSVETEESLVSFIITRGNYYVEPIDSTITQVSQALSDEAKARNLYPKKSILTNGIRVTESDEGAIYRFEVPESFLFESSVSVRCTMGSGLQFSFPAVVADVRHQFVFFLLPLDVGEMISEVTCEWNPSETVERLSKRWEALPQREICSTLVNRDFSNNSRTATKEPVFPSTFTESQQEAVKKSVARKISIIVGERKRGKTRVAASLMLSALREGKRVLYLTSTSGSLYDCMLQAASLNPAVAEESIAVIDTGIRLLPPLPIPVYALKGEGIGVQRAELKKLMKVVSAEHEYDRLEALTQKREEKHRQIEEATAEAEGIKAELMRMQSASMLERMKQRINKGDIDSAQFQLQNKLALVERLKQHAAMLAKEQFKKESQIPVPLKEKKEVEKLASLNVSLVRTLPSTLGATRCVAATIAEALKIDASQFGEFDVVCIDDAHALNLAEFFWCASHAKEQCFILADITEQPPQSVCQLESCRTWLQKDYFLFYQQQESNQLRFKPGVLPEGAVSELTNPDIPPSPFASCLDVVIDKTPLPQGAKGRIYFINTEDQRVVSEQYIGKKKILPHNEANARRVIECIKHALLSGSTTQSDILIVAPPSGQLTYLRERLKANEMNDVEIAALGAIRLCSKRCVIFDTTVAGIDFTLRMLDDKKSGPVRVVNTLDTLLSTVMEEFYIIADLSHFTTLYKDRFITKLLDVFKGRSENTGNILNAARRFDELPPDMRRKVLLATADEKQTNDYKTKLEQAKLSAVDTSKSAAQQSIALVERKLKNDIHSIILRVLAKRELINIVAQYLEAYPLFKTTQETLKYSATLADLDCENEENFKSVMNMWNVLIYESSDAKKASHPLATKAKVDAKISTDIRQIYEYYHSDIEMVVEEGKHKLAQSIQRIFNDCIGRKPVTPTDWMNAYLVFLGRMEKYLDTVTKQIRM
jgi:hypothetical protein